MDQEYYELVQNYRQNLSMPATKFWLIFCSFLITFCSVALYFYLDSLDETATSLMVSGNATY